MTIVYWTNVSQSAGFLTTWSTPDGRGHARSHNHGQETWSGATNTPAESLCQSLYGPTYGPWKTARASLGVGEFHPRVQRRSVIAADKQAVPPMAELHARACGAARASARNLFAQFDQVFRYVEPSHDNRETYGDQLRSLLILACTEVESSWRAVIVANGGADEDARLSTNEYVAVLKPMRLDEWSVSLSAYPEYGSVYPFKGWHKESDATAQPPKVGPTRSLPWYAAYNATKHNRESNLRDATLEHVITAMCAAYVMLVAQFGPEVPKIGRHSAPVSWLFQIDAFPDWPVEEFYVPPTVENPDATWRPRKFFAAPLKKP